MIEGRRMRAMRVALAAVAMGVAATAGAADYRIGATPDWVRPVPFDSAAHAQANAANVAYGTRYDLIDEQVRLTANSRTRFHHVVSEAVTEKGIDELSHREVEVDPSWESLTLSQLDVIRDGKRVSRLKDVQVKVLQRERDLESRIYDGRKSINLDLPDIRVGDIVEFAYTLSGVNPVFAGHHGGALDMGFEVPVAHLHRRLSTAAGMNLTVKPMAGAVAPQVSQSDGFDERVWDARDVPGLHREKAVPGSYNAYPWVEWSDYATWGDVARWAESFYAVPAQPGPALREAIDAIAKQSPEPGRRIAAVLKLVQQQVRYLGVEIGAGTHRPSAPDVVYARRWGDCKEKALLMVTMLRSLGVAASPALVNTDRRAGMADDLPNGNAFDHVIAWVHVDGLDYWFDPTLSPQQGTLATLSQPDYGLALLLDGRSTALTPMPAATIAAHSREVQVDIDSRAGADQPVTYDVRTTFHGFAADRMRNDLGGGERSEMQHRYLNFYATSYPGIAVAAPIEVRDDGDANTVVVTEHYTIRDFWAVDAKGARIARFHVPDIEEQLKVPEETIRSMPMSVPGPQSLREQVRVQLPMPWPERRREDRVDNAAFKLAKSVRVEGQVLTTDYLYEVSRDQIDASAVAGYAADLDRAQDLVGYHLSTGSADAPPIGASGATALRVVGGVAVLFLAGWWIVGLRRSRRTSTEPVPVHPGPLVDTTAPPPTRRGDPSRTRLWLLALGGLGFGGYFASTLLSVDGLPEKFAWGLALRVLPLLCAGVWAGMRLWQSRGGRELPPSGWPLHAARCSLLAMYAAGVVLGVHADVVSWAIAAWLSWLALVAGQNAFVLRMAQR